MNKLERQQKKIEAIKKREELKQLKKAEKAEKKARRKEEKGLRKPPKEKKNKKNKESVLSKRPDLRPTRELKPNVETELQVRRPGRTWKKVIAILLWVVIAFFTFQGVMSVVNRESTESIKRNADEHYSELTARDNYKTEAGTFVGSFLREYYTFGEQDDWSSRVGKYLASDVSIDEPSNTTKEELMAYDIRRITIHDSESIDVDAYIEVSYVSETTEGDKKIVKEGKLKHLVRVPIRYADGNYAVMSEPVYIPDKNRAEDVEAYSFDNSSMINDDSAAAVETTIGNFMKAYYGTKSSELKYYVTKNFGSVKTVGKDVKFVKIDSCEVASVRGGYLAKTVAVLDNGFGTMKETVYITLVKGDSNRLYVDKLETHP